MSLSSSISQRASASCFLSLEILLFGRRPFVCASKSLEFLCLHGIQQLVLSMSINLIYCGGRWWVSKSCSAFSDRPQREVARLKIKIASNKQAKTDRHPATSQPDTRLYPDVETRRTHTDPRRQGGGSFLYSPHFSCDSYFWFLVTPITPVDMVIWVNLHREHADRHQTAPQNKYRHPGVNRKCMSLAKPPGEGEEAHEPAERDPS